MFLSAWAYSFLCDILIKISVLGTRQFQDTGFVFLGISSFRVPVHLFTIILLLMLSKRFMAIGLLMEASRLEERNTWVLGDSLFCLCIYDFCFCLGFRVV